MGIKYLIKMNIFLSFVLAVSLLATSCYKEEIVYPGTGLADWSADTHSGQATPNYEIVFPQDKVNRIDLVIGSDAWESMLQNLTDYLGEFGTGGNNPPPPIGMHSDFGFFNPPPPAGDSFTPIFAKASVFFNGIEWYHVGVRFKGNSSLRTTWQQGLMKLAFRLDFDEFEDDYPEIKNQRFYGFQKLSLSNNFEDNSYLHEKVAADIFRHAGLKSPHTAYYAIYVDYGEGPVYFGLYTGVEIVEDTMLKDQFGSDHGNCYKPEGVEATFAYGTFNESGFDLKTNEDIADYSDVNALYEIVNSNLRLSDTEQWKDNLESIFDVDNFLHWLAVNTIIQNWDSYGIMYHNYYLYNNPYNNKLVWIPWDNNEALAEGKMGNLSLSMSEVTNQWPLIRYILDQDEYKLAYEKYLQQTIDEAFNPSHIKDTYQYYYNLIYEYVEAEQPGYSFINSISDFINALNAQNNHVDNRYDAVVEYLTN